MVRRGLAAIFTLVTATLGAMAQPSLTGLAPPVPTGAPLPATSTSPTLPSWLEEKYTPPADSYPPTILEDRPPHVRPWHPNAPPTSYAGSACNFNLNCGDNIFSPDYQSCQVLVGGYWSSSIGPSINSFNYLPITFRAGWMLTAPDDNDGDLRGNWECLTGLNVAPIISKYGHCLIGPSVYLRRNLVSPGSQFVPYAQIGAGFIVSDANKADWQHAIGSAMEAQFHAQIGCRYFISDNWSLDIEGGLQNINNLNLASRNAGVNAIGAQIGFTYHFPTGGK